ADAQRTHRRRREPIAKEHLTMATRIDPEAALLKEHSARQAQRAGTFVFNLVAAALAVGAGAAVQYLLISRGGFPWVLAAAGVVALGLLLSLRISLQWDRAVVMRMGRFYGLRGPGV